jgi:hypothetical protein
MILWFVGISRRKIEVIRFTGIRHSAQVVLRGGRAALFDSAIEHDPVHGCGQHEPSRSPNTQNSYPL